MIVHSNYKKLINIQTAIICILPAALVSGPFISDLICIISGMIFLYITIKEKKYYFFSNNIFKIFTIFYFYLLLSSALSSDPLLSFESSLFYFRFIFFAFSIWFLLEHNHNFTYAFSISLMCILFIVLIDGYIQYFTGYNILGFQYNGQRISGFFGDELKLGMYLAHFLPILFGVILAFKDNQKYVLYTCMIFLIGTDVLIFLSGERTAFFKLTLITLLIILLVNKWKLARIITFVISIILITFITLSENNVRDRMVNLTMEQTGINSDETYIFSSNYQSLYSTAYKIFNDNYIIGIGPKMYRELCKDEKYVAVNSCSTHPHNSYMQLLSETGLIGFLFVACFFIFLSIKIIQIFLTKFNLLKNKQYNDVEICFYIAVFVSLWPFMPTLNFFNNWINVIYYLPVGFLLYFSSNNKIE